MSFSASDLSRFLAITTVLLKTAYFGSVFVGGFVQLMMHTTHVLYTTLFQLIPAGYVWKSTLLEQNSNSFKFIAPNLFCF